MTEQAMIDLMLRAVRTVIFTAAPPLAVGLSVGLLVSIFQTVTSIQDATLTFVPKILAIFFALTIFGPFMMQNLMEFMRSLFSTLHLYVR